MASYSQPRPYAYKAGGTIALGHAVKMSADDTVVECTANTDAAIGVAMNNAASGERVEVALPGGGYKMVCSENITRGKKLVPHTDGTAAQANAAGDRIVAMALASGAAGDLIPVEVMIQRAGAADE